MNNYYFKTSLSLSLVVFVCLMNKKKRLGKEVTKKSNKSFDS